MLITGAGIGQQLLVVPGLPYLALASARHWCLWRLGLGRGAAGRWRRADGRGLGFVGLVISVCVCVCVGEVCPT